MSIPLNSLKLVLIIHHILEARFDEKCIQVVFVDYHDAALFTMALHIG